MRRIAKLKKQRMCALTAAIVASAWMPTAMALPVSSDVERSEGVNLPVKDGSFVTKTETVNQKNYDTLEIGVKDAKGIINWKDFNIGSAEQVKFVGKGPNWSVLNRVNGGNLSNIEGILKGQDAAGNRAGTIFLINPAGITFGAGAHVDVGSLVASTLDITEKNFMAGNYTFGGPGTKVDGVIKNLADIKASDTGMVALIAHRVYNGFEGYDGNGEPINLTKNTIEAGQVVLTAGTQVTLSNPKIQEGKTWNLVNFDDKISVAVEGLTDTSQLETKYRDLENTANKIWENLDQAAYNEKVKRWNDAKTDEERKNISFSQKEQEYIKALNDSKDKLSEINNKLDQVVNLSNVNATNGYVLMTAGEAKNIISATVNNFGVVQATRLSKDETGNIVLQGNNVDNFGTLSADNGVIKIHGNQINVGGSLSAKSGVIKIDGNETDANGKVIKLGGGVSVLGNLSVDGDYSKDAGRIDINGERVLIAGTLSADGKNGGTINTTAADNLQVFDEIKDKDEATATMPEYWVNYKANVHAKAITEEGNAGTWNIFAAQAVINDTAYNTDNPAATTTSSDLTYNISNQVISQALNDANVNIKVAPTAEHSDYYSDIKVEGAITKNSGKDTNLTMTAGRNISVDADITSKAGALNVQLNANNQEATNSKRGDGAVTLRANVDTNGGNFETTGSLGTYIGLRAEEAANTERKITTCGGNVTLGGAEVLLATGKDGKVVINTTNNKKDGTVYINGTVNSANAYSYDYGHDDKGAKKAIGWEEANSEAENKGMHLAVITSPLENAVVSAVIPKDTGKNSSEAYIGGHVVKVNITEDGKFLDQNGNIITYSVDTQDGIMKLGSDVKVDEIMKDTDNLPGSDVQKRFKDEANLEISGDRGWYKIGEDKYIRFWAWTTGNDNEKNKVFMVQVADDNGKGGMPIQYSYKINDAYNGFKIGEPNDDSGKNAQLALAVNYDTFEMEKVGKVYYSKWDDISNAASTELTDATAIYNYALEKALGNSSLTIKAGETTLNGAIGNVNTLNNLNIDSSANINVRSSVKVDNNVVAKAAGNITVDGSTNAGGLVDLVAGKDARDGDKVVAKEAVAGHNVTTGAVSAGKTISMVAENNVIINGAVNAKAPDNPTAVEIVAQGNFYNKAKDSKNAVQVGEGSAWKIYTTTYKEDNLGELNSGKFAGWGWGNKENLTYIPGKGNRFIFKENPTVTYTALDDSKVKGVEVAYRNKYTVANDIDSKYKKNFSDADKDMFMARDGVKFAETASKGYPADAAAGEYEITMVKTDAAKAWGYAVVTNPGKLTVIDKSKPEPKPDTPKPSTSETKPDMPKLEDDTKNPGYLKPQMDALTTSNLKGSASYSEAARKSAPGADRVLGLQSAELPFFREELGKVKLYGTYDVSIDPDKVKMEPTAKVLPEPDQTKNQYREYEKELTTEAGTAKFKMTYNGSTFDIYPVDSSAKAVLVAGDAAKNVEVESQALFAAFKEMGITLDDLDGVYTHFDSKKEVQSFRH